MEILWVFRIGFVCLLFTLTLQTALAEEPDPASPLRLLEDHSCAAAHRVSCKKLQYQIHSFWKEINSKVPQHDRALLRLKLNHALEVYRLLAQDRDPDALMAIDLKYQALQDIVQSTRRLTRDAAPNVAYHHLEMQAVQDVMNRFGRLELYYDDIGSKDAPRWQKREVDPPWAGYWFPRYDPVLYAGEWSVFAKLDRMMGRIGRESQAQALEASMSSGHPESWEGLCNAWSNASIMEREPQSAVQVLGEYLSVAEQKALFTKIYEAYPVTVFGVRYDGDFISDGTYQDIRPEALHRLVLSILGEARKPFIIDDTAGTEVWQQPVFRVEWAIRPDDALEHAYVVSMRLWKIKMRSKLSDELTNRNDYAFDQYEYRLFVDPYVKAQEGRLIVIAGEWLGMSRKNHPDYVVLPQDNGWPASHNSWIQQNLEPILGLLRYPSSFTFQPE